MRVTKALGLALAFVGLFASACGKSRRPLIVGSKNTTEQILLGEIVAQHLEHRLGRKIQRRLDLGGTLIVYQALMNREISLYPEYTGAVEVEILKEGASPDASLVFERVRSEMQRVAQVEVLDPLGIDNGFVLVVRNEDAQKNRLETLTDAAHVKDGWKLGVSYDFNQRRDGMPALNTYKLPLSAPVRSMEAPLLYKALEQGQLTMIAVNATDGMLLGRDWKVLRDDNRVFAPYQACLMVRQDALSADPGLRTALRELSGKFNKETMRGLNAQVEKDQRQPHDVATAFLAQAGLK
jgi:osmoprotectant transport system substrate-binding protein